MDHGLMQGMFWGGVVMSAVPILFGLGLGAFVLHRYRTGRGDAADAERRRTQ